MGNIERIEVGDADWDHIVAAIRGRGDELGVPWRDAIVLLPFAQLLPLARAAWARQGGFLPRIETTQTLLRQLAPPRAAAAGQISFDPACDRLIAARMLREQAWARAAASSDPLRGEQMVASLVEAALAMARAAASVPPTARGPYWQRGRTLLSAPEGPGVLERALARIALEWAAAGDEPASDALYALRPSAWVLVQAGGRDRLAESLLEHAGDAQPCLAIDTDVAADAPFASLAATAQCDLAVCDDFEDEAQRAAAQVLAHLAQRRTPVAVIAQDRALVRRMRALLARRDVPLADETGWTLSTTRAAALPMSLLRAMRERTTSDEVLEWLKAAPAAREGALARLEGALRKNGWASVDAVDVARLDEASAALWRDVQQCRAAFATPASRSLIDWLDTLRDTLARSGNLAALESDAAGAQVLRALRLEPAGQHDAWFQAAAASRFTLDEFIRHVSLTLEDESFVPIAPSGEPQVIVTPLARAMLRPFAAVVFPGADERRLGSGGTTLSLLSDAQAAALGIDGAAQHRERELLAFAQLLRRRHVNLLRRRRDGDEAVGASPLVERLAIALRRAGRQLAQAEDQRAAVELAARASLRPQPKAGTLLPAQLSASAIEALRECPYRFYSLYLLRLREAEELDEAIDKRSYGNWLHAVLDRFHRSRTPNADDAAQLSEAAGTERAEHGLDEAAFLPYAAQFERFMPRYLEWLRARDEQGAQFRDGELELRVAPPELHPVELVGRIDRIDALPGGTLQLIDYKSGSTEELKRRLAQQPAEDTQLAVYAALLPPQPLDACYLGLEHGQALRPIVHPDVQASAALLLQGLGTDLQRVREGSALPALGEGNVCNYCRARGLCRRDDWP